MDVFALVLFELISLNLGTFFGVRVRNQHPSYGAPPAYGAPPPEQSAPQQQQPQPSYGAQYGSNNGAPSYRPQGGFNKPNIGPIINELSNIKAGALRTGANALRFKVMYY